MKLNDPDNVQIVLPALGINITSIDPSEDRMQQRCNQIISNDGKVIMSPAPVEYSIDLTAFTKKESELFQIIEYVMPKFQRDVSFPLIEFELSDGTQLKRDLPIILNSR